MKILVIHGFEVILDDEDFERVSAFSWRIVQSDLRKYGLVYFIHSWSEGHKIKNIILHRFVMGSHPGDPIIDHANGNTLDNRKANLRPCTHSQNCWNCKKPKNNTSGYKGVVWDKSKGKWIAQIQVYKKRIKLGTFDIKEEAAKAYRIASLEYHGQFGRVA